MTVMEAIEKRRSIRRYADRPIDERILRQVAEAFRLAPSARNGQDWKLIAVRDPALKQKIREASPANQPMLTEAPAILIAVGKRGHVMTCGHRADTVDLSIALSFAVLRACELGLGTCWMANFREDALIELLGLPEDSSIPAICPIGYAAEEPPPKPRKSLDEIFDLR